MWFGCHLVRDFNYHSVGLGLSYFVTWYCRDRKRGGRGWQVLYYKYLYPTLFRAYKPPWDPRNPPPWVYLYCIPTVSLGWRSLVCWVPWLGLRGSNGSSTYPPTCRVLSFLILQGGHRVYMFIEFYHSLYSRGASSIGVYRVLSFFNSSGA